MLASGAGSGQPGLNLGGCASKKLAKMVRTNRNKLRVDFMEGTFLGKADILPQKTLDGYLVW
jgi:hypothetical protein